VAQADWGNLLSALHLSNLICSEAKAPSRTKNAPVIIPSKADKVLGFACPFKASFTPSSLNIGSPEIKYD
jgi:hypothetical protein